MYIYLYIYTDRHALTTLLPPHGKLSPPTSPHTSCSRQLTVRAQYGLYSLHHRDGGDSNAAPTWSLSCLSLSLSPFLSLAFSLSLSLSRARSPVPRYGKVFSNVGCEDRLARLGRSGTAGSDSVARLGLMIRRALFPPSLPPSLCCVYAWPVPQPSVRLPDQLTLWRSASLGSLCLTSVSYTHLTLPTNHRV